MFVRIDSLHNSSLQQYRLYLYMYFRRQNIQSTFIHTEVNQKKICTKIYAKRHGEEYQPAKTRSKVVILQRIAFTNTSIGSVHRATEALRAWPRDKVVSDFARRRLYYTRFRPPRLPRTLLLSSNYYSFIAVQCDCKQCERVSRHSFWQ